MRMHFRVPPFAKNAKDGAPMLLVMPAKSKAWATRLRTWHGGTCLASTVPDLLTLAGGRLAALPGS
jgi:hypothetical protein